MHTKETETRRGILKYLTDTAVATDESSIGELLSLFNPDPDRAVMGKKFESVLGYNPITQFDFNDIIAAVDQIRLEDANPDLASALLKMSTAISKRAMAIFEANRSKYFKECLAEAGMEILDREKGEEFSIILLGRIYESEEDEDGIEEGIATELEDGVEDDLKFPGSTDEIDEFGLEDGEDDD